jgi:putative redox protein
MSDYLTASAELMNDKMMFRCTSGDNPEVITDYTPPLGDGQGYTSLELFLASLCSCLGGTAAVFLRRMGKNVGGLSVSAKGLRRKEHPTCFETIDVSMSVVSGDAADADVEKVLKMAEETYCPVLAMIKGNVQVSVSFEIVRG